MLNKLKPTLAIVDSGLGGISVLRQLIKKYSAGNYIYYADNLYMPYGKKDKQFLINRLNEIITTLNEKYKPNKIIVACNTVSSALISGKQTKNVMIMPFNAQSTYLTTTLTAKNLTNCKCVPLKNLAKQIEKNIGNKQALRRVIKTCVNLHKLYEYKELVLGCTHFELVADEFKKLCPNTKIINNTDNLLQHFHFNPKDKNLTLLFLTSKLDEKYIQLLRNVALE